MDTDAAVEFQVHDDCGDVDGDGCRKPKLKTVKKRNGEKVRGCDQRDKKKEGKGRMGRDQSFYRVTGKVSMT